MSASFDIDREQNIVWVSYSGYVTAQETMENFDNGRAHADWSAELDAFVDMSGMTGTDVDFNQMLGIVHRKTLHLRSERTARMAFWAPTDLGFAVARMYAALIEDPAKIRVEVFRLRNEALAFLGRTSSGKRAV